MCQALDKIRVGDQAEYARPDQDPHEDGPDRRRLVDSGCHKVAGESEEEEEAHLDLNCEGVHNYRGVLGSEALRIMWNPRGLQDRLLAMAPRGGISGRPPRHPPNPMYTTGACGGHGRQSESPR